MVLASELSNDPRDAGVPAIILNVLGQQYEESKRTFCPTKLNLFQKTLGPHSPLTKMFDLYLIGHNQKGTCSCERE